MAREMEDLIRMDKKEARNRTPNVMHALKINNALKEVLLYLHVGKNYDCHSYGTCDYMTMCFSIKVEKL